MSCRLPRPAATLPVAVVTLLAMSPGAARAHDMHGYVSKAGLDFLGAQVPRLLPKDLYPAALSKDILCMTATQRDTHVQVQVDDFTVVIPQQGRLRLSILLSATGDGELYVDDAIACFGSLTCQDHIMVKDARATMEFAISLVNGQPSVEVVSADVQLSSDDIDLDFSDCAVDKLANVVVDFAKKYVLDYLLSKIETMAREQAGPKLEELLGSIGAYKTSLVGVDVTAELNQILVDSGGIDLGGELDFSSSEAPAECITDNGDEPESLDGDPPDLRAVASQIGLSVNFGAVDDALYQLWRRGLTCITGDQLGALGIDLPLAKLAEMMPGFPPGTSLGVSMAMAEPPSIEGAVGGDGATARITIHGIQIDLVGKLPDGGEKHVHVGIDAAATAAVGVDRTSNALIAVPIAIDLERMEMDQVYAAETGFDVTRVMSVLKDYLLPRVIDRLGPITLTGPIFKKGQYAVILRALSDNDAYLAANADLFAVPTDDYGRPETSIIDYPVGLASPRDALIRVTGVDGLVPTELLEWKVTVNGTARKQTFVRTFHVGQVGESGTYDVQVAAVDLTGNEDDSPASVQVKVDGISPQVLVAGDRIRLMEGGGETQLAWTMSDDLTATPLLEAHIDLYRVTDRRDALAVEQVDAIELLPGSTSGTVTIADGELYRAEVHVTDSVGNETVATVLLDASGGAGCGCRTGGSDGLAAVMLGLAAALLVLRRRRS